VLAARPRIDTKEGLSYLAASFTDEADHATGLVDSKGIKARKNMCVEDSRELVSTVP
jgi:hypothetical protein